MTLPTLYAYTLLDHFGPKMLIQIMDDIADPKRISDVATRQSILVACFESLLRSRQLSDDPDPFGTAYQYIMEQALTPTRDMLKSALNHL
jgi:hypothetical protein